MVPKEGTEELTNLQNILGDPDLHAGLGRSPNTQGAYQIAALGVTLVIAIAGGVVTGTLLVLKDQNR